MSPFFFLPVSTACLLSLSVFLLLFSLPVLSLQSIEGMAYGSAESVRDFVRDFARGLNVLYKH